MSFSTLTQSVYDVTKCKGHLGGTKKNKRGMEKHGGGVYRDSNGSLIAEGVLTWEEIKRRIQSNEVEFGRSTEVSSEYRANSAVIKKEWASMDDYCKHIFLRFPASERNEDGRRVRYVDDNAMATVDGGMRIVKNDFPYRFSCDIMHYVLWSTKQRHPTVYQQFVETMFPSTAYDVIMFENAEKNKSVKSVIHVQLFVRQKSPAINVQDINLHSN